MGLFKTVKRTNAGHVKKTATTKKYGGKTTRTQSWREGNVRVTLNEKGQKRKTKLW